jgi:hypothetical protein
MKASLLFLLSLSAGSLLAIYCAYVTLTTSDAEGRLLFAVVTGGLAAALLPLWGLFLKKSAFWFFMPIVVAGLYAVMALNAWACRISGTHWTHTYDQWGFVLVSLPTMSVLLQDRRQPKPVMTETLVHQEDAWPPPPKPPAT